MPSTQHIARWNGNNWLAMPEGDLIDSFNSVNDFIYFNGELLPVENINQSAQQQPKA
ncbi:MAG: hypothetical protein U0T81_18455 [Saprospiraceae bacterium]